MNDKLKSVDDRLREAARKEWEAQVAAAFKNLKDVLKTGQFHDSKVLLPSEYAFVIRNTTEEKPIVEATLSGLLHRTERACISGGMLRAEDAKVSGFIAQIDTLGQQVEELRWATQGGG